MQADNIRMVESPLDFELTFHLAKEIKLLKHILENNFKSTRHTSRPLNCFKDLTEFATTDGLDA